MTDFDRTVLEPRLAIGPSMRGHSCAENEESTQKSVGTRWILLLLAFCVVAPGTFCCVFASYSEFHSIISHSDTRRHQREERGLIEARLTSQFRSRAWVGVRHFTRKIGPTAVWEVKFVNSRFSLLAPPERIVAGREIAEFTRSLIPDNGPQTNVCVKFTSLVSYFEFPFLVSDRTCFPWTQTSDGGPLP